jgi:hypothetical protein
MNEAQNSAQSGSPEHPRWITLSFSQKVFEPLPIYMVDHPRAVVSRHHDAGSCREQGRMMRPVQRKLTHG